MVDPAIPQQAPAWLRGFSFWGYNGPVVFFNTLERVEIMISFNTPNRAYLVTSHGNGWAYEITDQQTGASLWFQDDDATQLQKETNDFEHESILDQYFECIDD